MRGKINIKTRSLSEEDRKFALQIAMDFEIPVDEMGSYISDLRTKIEHLSKTFWSLDLIGGIDYKGELSVKESDVLKSLSWSIVAHVNDNFHITKFRKYIIAGLILIHYKIDKYERIMTQEEYDRYPTDWAQDYKHYLYDRMKSRFKRLKKFK